MDILNKIKQRILDISNPDVDYNQEDFDKEFETPSVDYNKLNVSFTNKSTNQDPEYATSGSSGFDFRANLSEPVTIGSGKIAIIPTGLFFVLPENFEIQVTTDQEVDYFLNVIHSHVIILILKTF